MLQLKRIHFLPKKKGYTCTLILSEVGRTGQSRQRACVTLLPIATKRCASIISDFPHNVHTAQPSRRSLVLVRPTSEILRCTSMYSIPVIFATSRAVRPRCSSLNKILIARRSKSHLWLTAALAASCDVSLSVVRARVCTKFMASSK